MVLVHSQSVLNDDPALQQSDEVKSLGDGAKTLIESQAPGTGSSDVSEATASESDDEQPTQLAVAKATLKEMLEKHNRSAKHPEVMKAVEDLAALNPTQDVVLSPYLEGPGVALTRPEFPGRLKQQEGNEHVDQFTLGRMSFNIFQPADLVCTITQTANDLILNPEQQEGESMLYGYPLITSFIIHTPKGDFPASLNMQASCTSDKQEKNRLGVTFSGGTLTPGEEVTSDPAKLALWKEVFAGAYKKAEEERSYLGRLGQYVLRWMLQLTTPTDEEIEADESCSASFAMGRCPHGYFDILYLDEDIRITRGNRGTVVIVERTAKGEDSE